MNKYTVEFDGINECGTIYYEVDSWWELIGFVKNVLDEMGGGCADIFDEEDDFVDNVEI